MHHFIYFLVDIEFKGFNAHQKSIFSFSIYHLKHCVCLDRILIINAKNSNNLENLVYKVRVYLFKAL